MSLKITPLAAESMGTRSMATFLECGPFRMLIDPGVSLAGNRYNLPPHPLEKWRLQKHLERIRLFAESSHAVIITCFHSDHFSEELIDIYTNKMVFMQNPNVRLSAGRRKRAFLFLNQIQGRTKDTVFMDNRTFEIGNLRIKFSKPVKCSNEDSNDPVIPTAIFCEQETFLFSSNIEGLFQDKIVHWIIQQKPTFLYLDGPDTCRTDCRPESNRMSIFFDMTKRLLEQTPLKTIIIDHHSPRDPDWRRKMKPLFDMAEHRNIKCRTAAEYRGEEDNLLEARRKKLYKDEPVSP